MGYGWMGHGLVNAVGGCIGQEFVGNSYGSGHWFLAKFSLLFLGWGLELSFHYFLPFLAFHSVSCKNPFYC